MRRRICCIRLGLGWAADGELRLSRQTEIGCERFYRCVSGTIVSIMVTLRVENVSEEMYERLKVLASERNCSVSAAVKTVLERELKRSEWWRDWDSQPMTGISIDSAKLIREAREERDAELARRRG